MAHLNKLILSSILIAAGSAAQADLQICNDSADKQSVAIGFSAEAGWTSEGWWNIEPGDCSTVVDGPLKQRYYYVRAEKDAGVFDGDGYFFCTQQEVFSIVGDTECSERGYVESDFTEVDIGEGSEAYTHRLTQEAMDAAQTGVPFGLQFCNETPVTQAVAIGFEGAPEEWTSQGWWVIDSGDCKRALADPLKLRYYYYRAEVRGGAFDGDGYTFCTSTEVFDIEGDGACEERGFDSEDFREIDVGAGADRHRVVLTAETGGRYVEVDATPSVTAGPPEAGLKICNETEATQAVAIGYEGPDGWTSEGWWNIEPDSCSTPISGKLEKRYYYYRAEVNGGAFGPGQYPFCTTPEVFEIVGDQDCEDRGYVTEDFAELDIGEGADGYSLVLTSENAGTVSAASAGGLRFCNETEAVQSVAVGYEGDEGWTSAGWWNVDPGECSTPLPGPLDKQYYYYRAEVKGGPFEGEGFSFCTTPEVFTIVGDQDCTARGYDTEDFREINIGAGVTTYTMAIVGDVEGGAEPPVTTDTGGADTGGTETGGTETGGTATATDVIDAEGGPSLRVCNGSGLTQDLAFGYEAADGWASEGWWVLEDGSCTTPQLDGQRHRFVYYRAVSEAADFVGQSYFFCTTSEEFTILGDSDCEARGYDRADFRELDTGPEGVYTLTLEASADAGPTPVTTTGGDSEEPVLGDRLGGETGGDPVPEPDPEPTVTVTPEPEPEPAPTVIVEPEPEPEPTVTEEPIETAPANPRRTGSRG